MKTTIRKTTFFHACIERLLPSCAVRCAITTTSQSAIVVAGSTVSFNCKTNAERLLRWILYKPQSADETYVFNGRRLNDSLADRYEVSNNTADGLQVTVTINRIQPSDAGRHQCREIGAPKYNHSFELIVLRKSGVFVEGNLF
jgi:hypothetical protein